jgi:hypothetical protein
MQLEQPDRPQVPEHRLAQPQRQVTPPTDRIAADCQIFGPEDDPVGWPVEAGQPGDKALQLAPVGVALNEIKSRSKDGAPYLDALKHYIGGAAFRRIETALTVDALDDDPLAQFCALIISGFQRHRSSAARSTACL